jgi:hypothetical protein
VWPHTAIRQFFGVGTKRGMIGHEKQENHLDMANYLAEHTKYETVWLSIFVCSESSLSTKTRNRA